MNYQIEYWKGRTVFIFDANKLTFDQFSKIIDEVIQPDLKCEEEITSWTKSFSFQKDNLKIYFEYFYDSNQYFSFELLPLKNNSKEELSKLKLIIEDLSNFIKEI